LVLDLNYGDNERIITDFKSKNYHVYTATYNLFHASPEFGENVSFSDWLLGRGYRFDDGYNVNQNRQTLPQVRDTLDKLWKDGEGGTKTRYAAGLLAHAGVLLAGERGLPFPLRPQEVRDLWQFESAEGNLKILNRGSKKGKSVGYNDPEHLLWIREAREFFALQDASADGCTDEQLAEMNEMKQKLKMTMPPALVHGANTKKDGGNGRNLGRSGQSTRSLTKAQ